MKERIKKIKLKVSKKRVLIATGLIIIIALIIFGVKYINDNYLGFTDIDVSDMVFIKYNREGFDATPELDWSGKYYNSNGYYDDYTQMLESTNLYTDEQIEGLLPSLDQDVYTSLGKIYTSYDLSTEKPLKNGDTLEITVNYNEEKAKEEKINITNNIVSFEISGLYNHVVTDDLTTDIFEQVGGLAQLKKDAINNNYGILDMTVTIPQYKIYLEAINDEGVQTNAYQKIDIVYQEKDDYNYEGIESDYYVCNRQFNIYEFNGDIKLDDVNNGTMDCIDKKSIDTVMNDATLKEKIGIMNDIELVNL